MRVHRDWLLLPQRLAVAEVHVGYSEARRGAGDAVPVRSVAAILAPLARAAATHPIRSLLVAGDLFERRFEPDLYRPFRAVLARLDIAFAGLVPGNHDRGIAGAIESEFVWTAGYAVGGWHVVHGDGRPPAGPIILGHAHPSVKLGGRKYPCFVIGSRSIVMPAFSADAAGSKTSALGSRLIAIVRGRLVEVRHNDIAASPRRKRAVRSPRTRG
jgi:metallophosphoesterase superfamily enzyme